jgi:hypothetical protein
VRFFCSFNIYTMARKSGRQQQRGTKQRSQRQQRSKNPRQQRSKNPRQQRSKNPRQQRSKNPRQQRSKNPRQQRRRTQKRPLNAFMQELNRARKSNSPSFDYNGKSYNRRELKTGMVVYKSA